MKIEATTHSQSRTASHITLSVGRKGGVVVDKELHDSSKNPIANKAVSQAVDEINAHVGRLEELPLVPGTQVDTVVQRIGGSNQSNTASRAGAVSLGAGNKLSAPYSMAEGVNNNLDSTKLGNHIEGSENIASNVEFSHIEGERNNVRNGKGIHVEGGNNEATDNYTHAEGCNNKVAGAGSHAEGLGNEVDMNSMGAHAEGTLNRMIGATYAHVEGYNNIAKAAQSHTEGSSNENRGFAAHVGGVGNTVSGEAAFAHGRGLKVDGTDQVAVGKYNAPRDEAIFSVGAGTSDTERKTPFYVDKNGNTWIKDFDEANPVEVNLQQVLAKLEDDDTKASQEITKTNTHLATAEKNISDNKAETNLKFAEVNEALENKAQVDERYPKLTAGFADNLVGRGEATPEEFVFQPTANDVSVQDGTARIKSIKGNSVVWNQQCDINNIKPITSGSTIAQKNSDGSTILTYYTEDITNWAGIKVDEKEVQYFLAEHIYGILTTISPDFPVRVGFTVNGGIDPFIFPMGVKTSNLFIITAPVKETVALYVKAANAINSNLTTQIQDGSKVIISDFVVFDLTKMFGAGNEPTTIEDFYARIPSGIDIHAYNAGEIISMNTEAIQTVGFNAWDEQWERGIYKYWSNGIPSIVGESYDNFLRSKNLIKVLPNKTYCVSNARYKDFNILGYDKDGIYQDRVMASSANVIQFTTPENCYYVKFYAQTTEAVAVYTNDICINLSNTGRRNGEYEPHETFTRDLGWISKIKDEKGNLMFQNGMRSAGSAADSIEWDSTKQKWVAVQRVGEVDLGTLDWYGTTSLYGSALSGFIYEKLISASFQNNNEETPNIICDKIGVLPIGEMLSKQVYNIITAHSGNPNRLVVSNNTYTSSEAFKAAMQGVMLYYELAEPIVTEIEGLPELDYLVWDFGTEEALSSVPSAPFKADIIYQFNAVDRIRENTLRLQQLEAMLSQMQAAFVSMTAQVNNEEV